MGTKRTTDEIVYCYQDPNSRKKPRAYPGELIRNENGFYYTPSGRICTAVMSPADKIRYNQEVLGIVVDEKYLHCLENLWFTKHSPEGFKTAYRTYRDGKKIPGVKPSEHTIMLRRLILSLEEDLDYNDHSWKAYAKDRSKGLDCTLENTCYHGLNPDLQELYCEDWEEEEDLYLDLEEIDKRMHWLYCSVHVNHHRKLQGNPCYWEARLARPDADLNLDYEYRYFDNQEEAAEWLLAQEGAPPEDHLHVFDEPAVLWSPETTRGGTNAARFWVTD